MSLHGLARRARLARSASHLVALLFTLGGVWATGIRPSRAEDGPEPILFATFAGGAERPFALDVNGDGHADLVTFSGDPSGDVWVALSEGGQKCRGASRWASGLATAADLVAVGDFDGDGRGDVAAVRTDGTIAVGVSDGRSSFVVSAWKCAASPEALARLVAEGRPLVAADVDGDGFADLLLLSPTDVPGECLWLRNTGLHAFEAPASWGKAPRDALAADLDGDGKADLAWWRAGRVLVARGGAAGAPPEVWAEGVPGPLLAAGDVNGDGKADLVTRGGWLLSHGVGLVLFRDSRLHPRRGAACCVGDLDGDGEGDLFVFERGDEAAVRVILSRGPHFAPPEPWAPLGLSPRRSVPVVALPGRRAIVGAHLVTGDGKLGILPPRVSPLADDVEKREVKRSEETRRRRVARPDVEKADETAGEPRAGDLDGDGLTDLVRRGERGLEWARGREDGSVGPWAFLGEAPDEPFALVPGRAGRASVVFAAETLALREDGLWRRRHASPFAGAALRSLQAARVLPGAGTQLVAFARPGAVLVARESEPGVFAAAEPWALEPASARPLFLGDLTGDGLADIVAETSSGLAVLVADPRLHAFRQVGPALRTDALPLGLADLTGDGEPSLLLAGRAGDLLVARLGGSNDRDADGLSDRDEVRIHGTDPLRRDTDGDGLLDGWEVRGFRGVRLDRLGASPTHRDLFLELAVEQGADMPRVDRAVARLGKIFGSAPTENPDGKTGIAFHGLLGTRPPLPDGQPSPPSRQELREMYFTPRRAGLFHWMHLGARGGGGQSDLWSDQGSCAGVFEATLPHELGHQIGLNHGGDQGTNGIPVYPSLMNYAYGYDLSIDFSRGTLAHLALDEKALPEVLEVPLEQIRYLAGPPFHFRVERLGATRTWVDWNRDGVRDERPVMANVNAIAGDGYGPRVILDEVAPVATGTSTEGEPALLDVSGDLALLYAAKGPRTLAARVLAAADDDPARFGPPRTLLDVAGLSEIAAVASGRELTVFAVGADGLVLEARGSLEAGITIAGVVSSTKGLRPSAVLHGETLRLFLLAPDGSVSCEGKTIEGVVSTSPVGVAVDTVRDELLLVTTDKGTNRLRLTRLDPRTLAVRSSEPVGGPHASDATTRRPAVLFETSPWLPPAGRVDIFHAGILDGTPQPNTHMYRSYTIGDRAWLGREGWKEDQFMNEWSYSTAGPGAALRHGRPWQVTRFWTPYGEQWTDHVAVAPCADGICDAGLRDHDDWALIRDLGLPRSLLHVSEPRGRVAIGK